MLPSISISFCKMQGCFPGAGREFLSSIGSARARAKRRALPLLLLVLMLASFLTDLSGISWTPMVIANVMIAVSLTFLGLFIAVSVREVFEAQTFSNFFRFPMIFLCGLFFSIRSLPVFLRPLFYLFPPTYGADILHGAIRDQSMLPMGLNFLIIAGFCLLFYFVSIRNVNGRWII